MSVLNFNTANQTFRHLLGNGLTYRVPPFQRDYAWADDEWDDLWQDIAGLFEVDGEVAHYMGYLVLQSPDSKRFDVIDGQQRITTLSLLVLAALGHLKDLEETGVDADNNRLRFESLRSSYIGYVDPVSLVPRTKLVLNRHGDRFYQTYLVPLGRLPQRKLNASEHQLRKAFVWFKERIKKRVGTGPDAGRQIAAFIEAVVDKLFFTVITVTDELNAFKVFETLNARGVRLSAPDLLKNYLFSLLEAGEAHAIEQKALEDRWERIVELLEDETFSEFLRVFWNSRHKLVRKTELFKAIRRAVTTRTSAHTLLRDLERSAEAYAALRDPGSQEWSRDEQEALQQLQMYGVRQPLTALLALHEKFFECERPTFARVLRAISVISLRYNVICNLLTYDQERVYNEVARGISDGTLPNVREILGALREIYPDDRQFKLAFSEKEFVTTSARNAKVVRHLLQKLEQRESAQALDFQGTAYSIEHILPQHPEAGWEKIPEGKQTALACRLGNMTMLEAGFNRKLGNQPFVVKQATYAQSVVELTRELVEQVDWTEAQIAARQSKLAAVATSIWRVEF